MRPLEKRDGELSAIDDALAWHDGDVRATIATLLADCSHLRQQLATATNAMSWGFARGWRPRADRE